MTSDENSAPRVSLIMRSKNSDWVIDRALAALFSQSYTDFELTVVDSGSTDRTLEIVRGYPCQLIEIEPGDYFPGAVSEFSNQQNIWRIGRFPKLGFSSIVAALARPIGGSVRR